MRQRVCGVVHWSGVLLHCRLAIVFKMGNLFSFGYDMVCDSVSNRLAVLMFSRIEDDAFINRTIY